MCKVAMLLYHEAGRHLLNHSKINSQALEHDYRAIPKLEVAKPLKNVGLPAGPAFHVRIYAGEKVGSKPEYLVRRGSLSQSDLKRIVEPNLAQIEPSFTKMVRNQQLIRAVTKSAITKIIVYWWRDDIAS
jgi:hypothetical protein